MKIRTRFVSNSSTSSYCMFGAYTTNEQIERRCRELDLKYNDSGDLLKHFKFRKEIDPRITDVSEPGDNGVVIGAHWPSIKDTETGAEFKAAIKNTLKKILEDDNVCCETLQIAWFNG